MTRDATLQPRAILNRVWFDKYPEKPREITQMWMDTVPGFGSECAVPSTAFVV